MVCLEKIFITALNIHQWRLWQISKYLTHHAASLFTVHYHSFKHSDNIFLFSIKAFTSKLLQRKCPNSSMATDILYFNNTNFLKSSNLRRCAWCNGYRRRNWTRRHEFKSWTDCISHSTNTLGKGINPIILPPAMGK